MQTLPCWRACPLKAYQQLFTLICSEICSGLLHQSLPVSVIALKLTSSICIRVHSCHFFAYKHTYISSYHTSQYPFFCVEAHHHHSFALKLTYISSLHSSTPKLVLSTQAHIHQFFALKPSYINSLHSSTHASGLCSLFSTSLILV